MMGLPAAVRDEADAAKAAFSQQIEICRVAIRQNIACKRFVDMVDKHEINRSYKTYLACLSRWLNGGIG